MANAQDLPGSLDAAFAANVPHNQHYQELARLHHSLEEQLHHLATQTYLTNAQQLEEVTLKKQKLAIKDQMVSLLASSRH
jgi:uncharacterized protein YdcH (DUF465 family)